MLHTHPIELVWLAVSLLLVGVAVYGFQRATQSQAFAISRATNGRAKLSADFNLRVEMAFLLVGVEMLISAITSMFLPPPPPGYNVLPQSVVIIVTMVAIGLTLAGASAMNRFAWKRLARYAEAEIAVDPETGSAVDRTGTVVASADPMEDVKAHEKPTS